MQQGKAKQVGEAGQGLGPKLSKLGFTGAYQAVAAAGQLGNCANVTTLACLSALYNYTGYAQKVRLILLTLRVRLIVEDGRLRTSTRTVS